jgi:hypothetical protein
MPAVPHRDMALGPIEPTHSSLLTQMSSNMAIVRRGHTFEPPDRGHIPLGIKGLGHEMDWTEVHMHE